MTQLILTEDQARLVRIVVQLGFVSPDTLSEFLGKKAGARGIDLRRTSIDQKVIALVPQELARRCVPRSIVNAVLDPNDPAAPVSDKAGP